MPQPTPRERRLAATRRNLAEHALRLFAERGYETTTVADIADAADMSTRTFFRHVRDKDDAMFAADDDVVAAMAGAVAAVEDGPPLVRLLAGLRALTRDVDKDAAVKCAREEVLAANPGLRARDLAQQARWQRQAEDLLRAQGVPDDGASLAAGIALTVWREAYRRWIATSAEPGTLEAHLDGVVAELPGHLAAPR